jgi:Tol biopolymer transport system component
MQNFFRAVMLVGAVSLLVMVGWLTILRLPDARESSMIAFVSNRESARWELYVMLGDGSNARRVLNQSADFGSARDPIWSPDGAWIAFSLFEANAPNAQIFRIQHNGTSLQQLTDGEGPHIARAWSPDGAWIAFEHGENVFTMRADGSHTTQITQGGSNRDPVWSPDGEWIIFLRKIPGPRSNFNLHRMRPDGSGLERLTPVTYADWNPAFSPDGAWIVFGSDLGTNFRDGYYRMRLADAQMIGLGDTFNQRVSTSPVYWSESGEWAVYQARPAGNLDIFRTRADGVQGIQLTTHQAEDWSPAWSPPISLDWGGWVNALAAFAMLFWGMTAIAHERFSHKG